MTTRLLFITLTATLFWLQLTQAYCVYNYLDNENSTVYVEEESVNKDISFKKSIGHNGKECCPYDNIECNPSGKREAHLNFKLEFDFGDGVVEKNFSGECQGGGGLAFYGSNLGDIRVYCTHIDGRVAQFSVKRPFLTEIPE